MPRLSKVIIIMVWLTLAALPLASVAHAALTKHALDTRANAACQTASDATSRLLFGAAPSDAAGWLRLGTALHAIERREIAALEKLSPPKSLAKLWRTYLLGLHHEERAIEPLYRAFGNDDKAKARKLLSSDRRLGRVDEGYARKLGAYGCV
jgi:hypothetical protein